MLTPTLRPVAASDSSTKDGPGRPKPVPQLGMPRAIQKKSRAVAHSVDESDGSDQGTRATNITWGRAGHSHCNQPYSLHRGLSSSRDTNSVTQATRSRTRWEVWASVSSLTAVKLGCACWITLVTIHPTVGSNTRKIRCLRPGAFGCWLLFTVRHREIGTA